VANCFGVFGASVWWCFKAVAKAVDFLQQKNFFKFVNIFFFKVNKTFGLTADISFPIFDT
jgi:hypothetical protein